MGWNAANEVKLQSLDFKHLLYTINLFREGAQSDVTLICKDGKTQSNSFFIAALFPVVKNVLSVSQFFDEDIFISLPDVNLSEIEVLFKGIQHCDEILQVGSGMKQCCNEYSDSDSDSNLFPRIPNIRIRIRDFLRDE